MLSSEQKSSKNEDATLQAAEENLCKEHDMTIAQALLEHGSDLYKDQIQKLLQKHKGQYSEELQTFIGAEDVTKELYRLGQHYETISNFNPLARNEAVAKHAFRFYTLAAFRNPPHLDARVSLGDCYFRGLGAKYNEHEAKNAYLFAAEQGHPTANEKLAKFMKYASEQAKLRETLENTQEIKEKISVLKNNHLEIKNLTIDKSEIYNTALRKIKESLEVGKSIMDDVNKKTANGTQFLAKAGGFLELLNLFIEPLVKMAQFCETKTLTLADIKAMPDVLQEAQAILNTCLSAQGMKTSDNAILLWLTIKKLETEIDQHFQKITTKIKKLQIKPETISADQKNDRKTTTQKTNSKTKLKTTKTAKSKKSSRAKQSKQPTVPAESSSKSKKTGTQFAMSAELSDASEKTASLPSSASSSVITEQSTQSSEPILSDETVKKEAEAPIKSANSQRGQLENQQQEIHPSEISAAEWHVKTGRKKMPKNTHASRQAAVSQDKQQTKSDAMVKLVKLPERSQDALRDVESAKPTRSVDLQASSSTRSNQQSILTPKSINPNVSLGEDDKPAKACGSANLQVPSSSDTQQFPPPPKSTVPNLSLGKNDDKSAKPQEDFCLQMLVEINNFNDKNEVELSKKLAEYQSNLKQWDKKQEFNYLKEMQKLFSQAFVAKKFELFVSTTVFSGFMPQLHNALQAEQSSSLYKPRSTWLMQKLNQIDRDEKETDKAFAVAKALTAVIGAHKVLAHASSSKTIVNVKGIIALAAAEMAFISAKVLDAKSGAQEEIESLVGDLMAELQDRKKSNNNVNISSLLSAFQYGQQALLIQQQRAMMLNCPSVVASLPTPSLQSALSLLPTPYTYNIGNTYQFSPQDVSYPVHPNAGYSSPHQQQSVQMMPSYDPYNNYGDMPQQQMQSTPMYYPSNYYESQPTFNSPYNPYNQGLVSQQQMQLPQMYNSSNYNYGVQATFNPSQQSVPRRSVQRNRSSTNAANHPDAFFNQRKNPTKVESPNPIIVVLQQAPAPKSAPQ